MSIQRFVDDLAVTYKPEVITTDNARIFTDGWFTKECNKHDIQYVRQTNAFGEQVHERLNCTIKVVLEKVYINQDERMVINEFPIAIHERINIYNNNVHF